MRKSMKQNFARKVKRIKSRKRRHEILAAYWGWCKWGDCKNLWKTISTVSYTHLTLPTILRV